MKDCVCVVAFLLLMPLCVWFLAKAFIWVAIAMAAAVRSVWMGGPLLMLALVLVGIGVGVFFNSRKIRGKSPVFFRMKG